MGADGRESWARADVVITTGGLGPTCDDRTRDGIADVLGQKLVFDPAIEQAIVDRFARFGRKMTANNLKQAYVFERGEVLPKGRTKEEEEKLIAAATVMVSGIQGIP